MNKRGPILLSALVVGGVFAVPAVAGEAHRVSMIKCGITATPGDCGLFAPSPIPLAEGEIRADDQGRVKVELKGAAPNTTFKVYIGNFAVGGSFVQRYPDGVCCTSIGTVTTNSEGKFDGPITTSAGAEFVFPAGTSLAQPNFVFTFTPVGSFEQAVYTTGFAITR